jgi:tryptophan 7-halogenase
VSDGKPPMDVVVLGRGVDLWLCVNALSRALGRAGVNVVAVELPSRLQPAHISATLPPLEALHAKLGIQESSLLQATTGSFSLGQNFVGVAPRAPGFFHAWAAYGAPIEGQGFFPCWLKAARNGFNVGLANFCLTAVAAQNGRVLLPDAATEAFGRTDYGYHLQTRAYTGYLKSIAAMLGVRIHEARAVAVERAADGSIGALLVDGSARVEGELFVDATGEDAVLIGQSLGVAREPWRDYFSVDRVLTARAPAFTSIPPFAEVRISRAGWTVLHPSRAATGVVHAYSSALVSDDGALESATAASGVGLANVSCQAVNHYVRAKVWEGNCVAVGGAACSLDPIHDVDLHVLQLGIVHLVSLFPVTRRFTAEQAEYNRLMRSYYERIRDFQCAFYALSSGRGEFWQHARNTRVPQTLAHKIATFRACGHIPPMEDETFSAESWQALLIGLGVVPESGSAAIDRIPSSRFEEDFRRMLDFIKAKVLEQPTHDSYLERLSRGSAA